MAGGYRGEGDKETLCDQMVAQTLSVYNTVINQVTQTQIRLLCPWIVQVIKTLFD